MSTSSCAQANADFVMGDVNCKDGFRAIAMERDPRIFPSLEVWLELRSGGETRFTQCVWRSRTQTTLDYGAMSRELALWRSIARYMNCGGALSGMHELVGKLLECDDLPVISWPDHYCLISTAQEVEEVQHIFADPRTGAALIFAEDAFTDVTTLAAMGASQDEQQALMEEDAQARDDRAYSALLPPNIYDAEFARDDTPAEVAAD